MQPSNVEHIPIHFPARVAACEGESVQGGDWFVPVFPVVRVGDNLFRLEDNPYAYNIFGLFWFDVLRLSSRSDGSFDYVRLVKRNYRCDEYMVTKAMAESTELEVVLAGVTKRGGAWERILGGMLLVYVPHRLNLDLREQLNEVARAVGSA